MKAMILLLLGAAIAATSPGEASAQAAPPVGLWQGQSSGDYLWLQADGNCSSSGTVNVSGRCTWNPSAAGGTLTMVSLNQGLILLNGVERCERRS